jgi:hypothetical protein
MLYVWLGFVFNKSSVAGVICKHLQFCSISLPNNVSYLEEILIWHQCRIFVLTDRPGVKVIILFSLLPMVWQE